MRLSESLEFEDVAPLEKRQAARKDLHPKEYDQVRAMSPRDRTDRFFEVFFTQDEAWLLFDDEGLVPLEIEPGRWVIPVWYHRDFVDPETLSLLKQTKGEVCLRPVPVDDFYDVLILTDMMSKLDFLVMPVGLDGEVITFGTAIDAAARRFEAN